MTLEEAFAAIEHLPAHEPLLVAHIKGSETKRSAGHIDPLEILNSLDGTAARIIDEFRYGDARSAILMAEATTDEQTVIAMGPESPQSIRRRSFAA
ncbi:hypothetical protein [Cupriavidus sp. USMAHM13]|uniref:hypothetical protein n=1 Tax=Cupriavidus sp. USMAHM13 TaxID=1389192 RepID=UPI0012EA699A|nr:hypothetical protein [Cupriavidus sp. USMAHM13]